MKKGLVLLVALFSTFIATAQELTFGPKVGMNVTGVTHDNGGSKAGLVVGVFGQYDFRENMAITADLLYSQQGSHEKVKGVSHNTNLNYLNLPILFNFYVMEGLAVKAGIQPGILIGARSVDKKGDIKTKTSIYSEMNVIDFSIPIGVSYDLPMNFIVDARYNIGVSRVWEKDNGQIMKGSNSVFQMTVGWKF